jgi:hypothetical protein
LELSTRPKNYELLKDKQEVPEEKNEVAEDEIELDSAANMEEMQEYFSNSDWIVFDDEQPHKKNKKAKLSKVTFQL